MQHTTQTESAINGALKRIPPLWPLANFVAVNPFVGLLDQPYETACATLARTTGKQPLQSPAEYLKAWKAGAITPEDVREAGGNHVDLLEALTNPPEPDTILPTVADFLDRERPHAH